MPLVASVITQEPQEIVEEFNGQSLRLVSPFRIIKVEQFTRTAKTGKPYTQYLVTASPVQNPSVKFRTRMFKSGFDQLRAILFLNDKSAIQAIINGRDTTFSGVLSP